MADYWVGTSGYNYQEWKGSFYPDDLPDKQMLAFYGKHFTSVEINYTFYRMPTNRILANWSAEVPDHFRFTLKARRYRVDPSSVDERWALFFAGFEMADRNGNGANGHAALATDLPLYSA